MFFSRIHRTLVDVTGVELTLLPGQRQVAAAPLFRDLLT